MSDVRVSGNKTFWKVRCNKNGEIMNGSGEMEDTAAKSPHKARVHNNLGCAYLLADRREEARREFATALQIDPQQIQSRFNLERLNAP